MDRKNAVIFFSRQHLVLSPAKIANVPRREHVPRVGNRYGLYGSYNTLDCDRLPDLGDEETLSRLSVTVMTAAFRSHPVKLSLLLTLLTSNFDTCSATRVKRSLGADARRTCHGLVPANNRRDIGTGGETYSDF